MFKNILTAVIVSLIVTLAVVGLVGGFHQSGQKVGTEYSINVPSVGANTLNIGSGCDQSYTTCTGAAINSLGVIKSAGLTSIATTGTTYTITAAQLAASTLFSITPNGATLTATLPASSTLSTYLPNPGDTSSVVFYNASSTAGVTLTLAGGTGGTLLSASSTATIQPLKAAELVFTRKVNTDFIVQMTTAN